MNDEIIAGLRNALERGQSLEQAAQSFVNAGYNPQEVKAALNELSGGVSDIVYAKEEEHKEEPTRNPLPQARVAQAPVRPMQPPMQNNVGNDGIQKQTISTQKMQTPMNNPNVQTAPSMQTQNPLGTLPPLPKLPGNATKTGTGVKSKSILVWIIICSIIFLAGLGYLIYYLVTR